MATVEEIRADADRVRSRYEQQVADVKAEGYVDRIENAHLAALWLAAQAELDDLRAQHEKAQRAARAARGRQAFGVADLLQPNSDPAALQISYRDALDRAEDAAGSGSLLRLMTRAIESDDQVLARGAAVVAFNRSHQATLDAYEAEHPGWTDLARESKSQAQTESLHTAVRFGLKKPRAFLGKPRSELEQYRNKVLTERRPGAAKPKRIGL